MLCLCTYTTQTLADTVYCAEAICVKVFPLD